MRRKSLGIFCLLLLCGILVYGNSLPNPFIWDDTFLISENYFITGFKHVFEIFKHHLYYSTAGLSNFYRPLQTFFLTLDYSLWKENPFGYHLTSLIFHIGCAFLIYLIITAVFKRAGVALMVSLLFLVHPVNSTVVDYISSRADSQAAFFLLLSFLLFAKYALGGFKKTYYFGSITAFILALLSKEAAIILPVLILAGISVVFNPLTVNPRPKDRGGSTKRKNISLKASVPYFLILGIYAFLRMTVLKFSEPSSAGVPSLYIRLLTSAESFVRLIGLIFVPLEIHIEKSIPFSRGLFQPTTIFSIAVLSSMLIFMRWAARRLKICFFGLLWFFICLIPMSNIVPINTTFADHWLYLPGFGFFLAVIGGASETIKKINPKTQPLVKRAALFIYALIILVFSLLTIKQNTFWREPLKFYQRAIKISPQSYRPHNEIGIIYLRQKKYDEAISEFKRATELNPAFDQAYDNLGVVYDMRGDFENAIATHKKAIQLNPNNIKAYNNLGNAYNNANLLTEAIDAYSRVLKLNPAYQAAYNNLGVAYYKKGMLEEARGYWEKALRIDQNFKLAQDNLKALNQRR